MLLVRSGVANNKITLNAKQKQINFVTKEVDVAIYLRNRNAVIQNEKSQIISSCAIKILRQHVYTCYFNSLSLTTISNHK